MDVPLTQLPPGDPKLVEAIVQQLKSGGKFDQFRKECLADVDTKPAYQNLQLRVESQVKKFLSQTVWKNDLNKNQLRDGVRKHVQESGMLDTGIDSIINQVVNPKIQTVILPCVEESVYAFLNIDPSQTRVFSPGGLQGGPDCSGVPRPLLSSDAPHPPGPHDGNGNYSHMPPQHMPGHPSTTVIYPPHVPQHLPPQMAPQHYPSQFAPPPPLPQHQPPPPPHYPPMYHVGGRVPSDDPSAAAARHYQPSMDLGSMGLLPPMGPGIGPPVSHPPLPPPSVPTHQPPPPMSLPPQIGPPPPPSAGAGIVSSLCPPYMGSDIDSPVLGPPGIDDIERRRDYRSDLSDPRIPLPMLSSAGESSDDRHEYSAAKFEDTRLPSSSSGRDASDLDQHIDRDDHHHSGKYDDSRLPLSGIDSPDLAKDRHSDYGRSGKYDSSRMEADHHHKERHEHRKKYEEHRRRSPSSPDDLRKSDSRHSTSHRTKYEDSRKCEQRSYERKYDDRRYDSDDPMDFDQPDSRASESRGSKSRHRRDPRDFGDEYSGHSSSQRAALSSKERSRHHHHKANTEERSRYRHLGGDMEERSHHPAPDMEERSRHHPAPDMEERSRHHPAPDMEERSRHHPAPDMEERSRHHPAPDMEERSRHHPAPDMEERSRHHPAPDIEERSRHHPAPDMEERSRHHPALDMEERSRHRGVADFEERSRPRPASDLDDSTHSLGPKNSALPPMETDVISSEEDDILGAKSASVSPATPKNSLPVGDSEEARDTFPRPHSAASDVGAAAGEVQRLSLRDKDHHSTAPPSPQPAPPHLPLFDAQSLDSISSNSSGFSFGGGGAASKTSSQASLHSLDGGDLRAQGRQGSHGAITPPPGDEPLQHGRRSPADGGRDPQSPDPVARVATPDGAMMQDSLLSGASPISADGSVDSADSNHERRPQSAASDEEGGSPLEPCAPGTEERVSPLLQPPPEPSETMAGIMESASGSGPAAAAVSFSESGSVSARPPSPVDAVSTDKKKDDKQEILDDHFTEKSVIVPKKDDEDDKDGATGGGGSIFQGTGSSSDTGSGVPSSTPTGESPQQQQKADTPAGTDSQTESESARLAKLREELKARNLHVVARPHHMPYHKIFKTPITVPREKEKVRVNGQLSSSSSSKKSSEKPSSVKKEIKSNYAPTAFENALLGLEYKKKVVLPNKTKPEQATKSGSLAKSSGTEVQAIVVNAKVEEKSASKSQKDYINIAETPKYSSNKDSKKVSDKDDLSSKQSDKYSNSKRTESHRSNRDSKSDGLKENRSDKSSLLKFNDDRRKSGLDSKPPNKHYSKTEDRRKHDDSKNKTSHDADVNSEKLNSEAKKVESSKSKDEKDRTGSSTVSNKNMDPKSSSDMKLSSQKDISSSSKLSSGRDSRSNSKEDPVQENKRDSRKSTPDSALEKNAKSSSKQGTKKGHGPSTKEQIDRIISSNSLGANDKRDLSSKKETLKKRPLVSSDSEDEVLTAKKPKSGHRSNDRDKKLKTPASNQSRESRVPKKKYSSSRASDSDSSCSRSSSESSSSGESNSSKRRSSTAKLLHSADEDFTPNLSTKTNTKSDQITSMKRTRGRSSSSSSSDSDVDNERNARKKTCSVEKIDRRNRITKPQLLSHSFDSDDNIAKDVATSSNSLGKLNSCKKKAPQLSSPSDSSSVLTSRNKSQSNLRAEPEPKSVSSSKDVDDDVLKMANNIEKRLSSAANRASLKSKSPMPLSDSDMTGDEDEDDHGKALAGKNMDTKKRPCSASLNSSQKSSQSMATLVHENSDTDSSDSAYEMLRQEVKTNTNQTTKIKFTSKPRDRESRMLSPTKRRKSLTSSKKSLVNTLNSNRTVPKFSTKKHKRSSGDLAGPEHIEVTKDGVVIMTESGKKILLSYDDSQAGQNTCSGLFNSDDEAESFEGFAGAHFSSDDGVDGTEFEGFRKVVKPSVVVLEDIFDFGGFSDCPESSTTDSCPSGSSDFSWDASKKYSALLNLIKKTKHGSPGSSPRKYKKKDLSLTVTGDMFSKDLPIKVFLDAMVKLGAKVTGFHAFLVKSPKCKNRKMDTTCSSPEVRNSSCVESPVTLVSSSDTLLQSIAPLQSRAERAASRGAKRVTPDTSDSELTLPQSLHQSSTLEDRLDNDARLPFTTSSTVLKDMGPMHSDLVLLTPEDDQLQSEGSCSSPKELEASSPYVPLSPSSDGSADGGVIVDHHDKALRAS